jgi:hypothetical protein
MFEVPIRREGIWPPAHRQRKRAQQHEVEEGQKRPRLDVSDPFCQIASNLPRICILPLAVPLCYWPTRLLPVQRLIMNGFERLSFCLTKIVFHPVIFFQDLC